MECNLPKVDTLDEVGVVMHIMEWNCLGEWDLPYEVCRVTLIPNQTSPLVNVVLKGLKYF